MRPNDTFTWVPNLQQIKNIISEITNTSANTTVYVNLVIQFAEIVIVFYRVFFNSFLYFSMSLYFKKQKKWNNESIDEKLKNYIYLTLKNEASSYKTFPPPKFFFPPSRSD